MSDFSIIIQGPLHKHSIDCIPIYQKFGKVIISCYNTDDWQSISSQLYHPYIDTKNVFIKASWDESTFGYNSHNIFRQCFTTLYGLKWANTKYSIKVRSDEKYTNLQPIIDKVLEYPERFITNNVFFKRTNEPLHPSDHVIAGRTDKLINGFSLLHYLCRINVTESSSHMPGKVLGIPWLTLMNESFIFSSWLVANHSQDNEVINLEYNNNENVRQVMLKYTEVVPIDEMGKFIWSMNSSTGRLFFNSSKELYEGDLPSIKSLKEI